MRASNTAKAISDGTPGWVDFTASDFPLLLPMLEGSCSQQHIPLSPQPEFLSTQDYLDPLSAVSINSFNLSDSMPNMQINLQQGSNHGGVDGLATMLSVSRDLSQSPGSFADSSEYFPSAI